MPRDEHSPSHSPDDRRPGGGAGRAEARNGRRGRSGYGVESIRPHLRAQLEMHRLMRPQFPPPEADKPDVSWARDD